MFDKVQDHFNRILCMRILVTGFEAFNGSQANPSEEVVRAFAAHPPLGVDLHTVILPVDSNRASILLHTALLDLLPQGVICLGEASGRTSISLEKVAINLLDFRIPDNAGVQLIDLPILPDAPAAYFSTLPLRLIQQTLLGHGIPVEISLSAGSYLCNQVFYELMHWLATNRQAIPAGFIHLPSLPQQVAQRGNNTPSMSLETIQTACRLVIDIIANP
jgi:pyroglutamyl-peptidase